MPFAHQIFSVQNHLSQQQLKQANDSACQVRRSSKKIKEEERRKKKRAAAAVVSCWNPSSIQKAPGSCRKGILRFKSNKAANPSTSSWLFSVPFCNVEVGWEDSYLQCLTLKNEFSQEDSNFGFLMRATIGNATIKTVSKNRAGGAKQQNPRGTQ